ncbi:MAG: DEAD/DEAH box helicase [Desulfopila sp.]|jgi:superfamily II DNA/RNA helicase|nr:DEAD/DEAH box helicase [Desulfopila sp.]
MSFNDFQFRAHIVGAVIKCGFVSPTPIQEQAIRPLLERRDLVGLAQTGTGKTAAFLLPTIHHLLAGKAGHVRALIMAPTRELAEQIHAFAEQIIAGTSLRSMAVYGGVSKNNQINTLRQGVDIVVACPGRLLDILRDKAINLGRVEHLILDEADHMFDQGFLPDIRKILGFLPVKRQTMVFSATMPAEIRRLAEEILHNPVAVQVSRIKPADTVEHAIFRTRQNEKTALLLHLLKEKGDTTTLVFTRTKFKAKNLAVKLAKSGFRATALQGNMSQNKRKESLDGFKNGTFNIMVATDIAARGIDVSGISHVVNFDMPDTAEAYIHRTGRTGRALCSGKAFTFATADDDRIVRSIEKSLQKNMLRETVPASLPEEQETERPQQRSYGKRTAQQKNRAPQKKAFQPKRIRQNRAQAASVFGLNAQGK